MDRKTILLTGGTGYLGSNLLKRLVGSGYKVILLKRSSSNLIRIKKYTNKVTSYDIDQVPLETVFLENTVDIILHCATDYGRRDPDPLRMIEANLVLPVKLIELGKNYQVNCFINTDTALDKSVSHYSLSKKQFRDWLSTYKKELICINVAIEHFYGPGDDETKFVTYIVRNLIKNADRIDLTKGEQERDFLYIDDAVDAFVKIIEYSDTLDTGFYEFEIGSSNPVSIREFVMLAKQLSGNDHTILNFGALPYREHEVMNSTVNSTAIARLGWKCRVTVKDGLKKMIAIEKKSINQEEP